jgi:hypothetical protein
LITLQAYGVCDRGMKYEAWNIGGLTLTGKNQSARQQTCPSATFSNTNITWSESGSNPGLPIETNKINARIIEKFTYLWKLKLNYGVQRSSSVSSYAMLPSL